MKIGVVGAGGIGSYYAGMLSRAGHTVRLLARGDHLDVIRARGLEVTTPDGTFVARPEVTDDGSSLTGCDYVIVSVKGYSLSEVADPITTAAQSGATVVPLLNGIDVAERLESLGVPRDMIVGGLVAVSLFRTAPGKVERRSPFDRMVLGELDNVQRDRTATLVAAFEQAGTTARQSDEIGLDLWRKFGLIVPMNVVSGLSRGPVGGMLATALGREVAAGSLHEVVCVSRVAGSALSDAEEAKLRADLFAMPPATRPSFLADLERGGPTELDLLVGNVSRLGHLHGVPTPIHDTATAAFRAATTRVGSDSFS
jgi:2-dehydropantoate 2-reductase